MDRDYLVPPRKLRLLQNRTLQTLYVVLFILTGGYVIGTGGEPLAALVMGLVSATIGIVTVAIAYVFYVGVHHLPEPE